jgi:hypothetical protein
MVRWAVKTVKTDIAPNAITDAGKALRFMLAGDATFTIRSMRTGTRYTFRVRQGDSKGSTKPAPWFVKMLVGSDNQSDYQYMGMITGAEKRFMLTKASRWTKDALPVVAFEYVWGALVAGRMRSDVEVWHEGRCGRCGRKLTVPESIETGLGPECARKG